MIATEGGRQLPLEFARAPARREAEDFLVAAGNRLAVEWIRRWPDWPGPALILIGPPGSGKSHLAGLWRSRTGAIPVDPGSTTTADIFAAGEARAVLVEGLERLAGDTAAETALLRLYNAIKAAAGTLLMTAIAPPSALPFRLPDLASRLNATLAAAIEPPDELLLRSLALKLFADRQLKVSEKLIEAVLIRAERSFAGVAAAVAAMDEFALEHRLNVNPTLASKVLTEG